MFQNTSMAGTGMLVVVIAYVLQRLGVLNVDNSQLTQMVTYAVEVVGYALWIIGQIRRPDLTMGFWRKS